MAANIGLNEQTKQNDICHVDLKAWGKELVVCVWATGHALLFEPSRI